MKKTFLFVTLIATLSQAAPNVAVQNYLNTLKTEANVASFSAERGREIFFKETMNNGQKISCTTCHTTNLKNYGENKRTGKQIAPMAPSANSKALTDVAEIKKWFKRNFNDVYARQGTAKEKGDVLTFLLAQ